MTSAPETGALRDFVAACDLFDRGVDAITRDGAGRVRIVLEMFHCDDPERADESKTYRRTLTFRPQDVVPVEGRLWHEGPGWLGTVLDFEAEGNAQRMGIEWRRVGSDASTWTALPLRGAPVAVHEVVADR